VDLCGSLKRCVPLATVSGGFFSAATKKKNLTNLTDKGVSQKTFGKRKAVGGHTSTDRHPFAEKKVYVCSITLK
jgi:hypothetical protein